MRCCHRLNKNSIGDEGLEHLSKALEKNRSLSKLRYALFNDSSTFLSLVKYRSDEDVL